jgi:hypothetical protein
MTETPDTATGPPRWDPRPGDGDLIWAHLLRQRGLDPRRFVRLDDGRVARVGADAEGEGEDR